MRDNKTEKIILQAAEEEFLLKGFVLMQQEVARTPDDTIETFEAKIHAVEHQLYWRALKSYIQKLAQEAQS